VVPATASRRAWPGVLPIAGSRRPAAAVRPPRRAWPGALLIGGPCGALPPLSDRAARGRGGQIPRDPRPPVRAFSPPHYDANTRAGALRRTLDPPAAGPGGTGRPGREAQRAV